MKSHIMQFKRSDPLILFLDFVYELASKRRMTSTTFVDLLSNFDPLKGRREEGEKKIDAVREQFNRRYDLFRDGEIAAYVVGSLGRGDVGTLSDLDLFILTTKPDSKRRRLDDLEVLGGVIEINRELGYGPFSNDGQYLKVYPLDQMLTTLGAPQDDSENLFTARMLLLLESQCVCNSELFDEAVTQILNHYFRDSRGKRTFRPLFILNDILRYWRTLCLNYELIRDDPGKPWRKKNINLKFSRMLTVFGTVLPLIAEPSSPVTRIRDLVTLSPHQRFAQGLDILNDHKLIAEYQTFLNDYESFLRWKEQMGSEEQISGEQLDRESRAAAERFAAFIHRAVCHSAIPAEYRRFLIL